MRYILMRLVQGIFILFGVSLITFFLPTSTSTPMHPGGWCSPRTTHHTTTTSTCGSSSTGSTSRSSSSTGTGSWAALHGNFGIAYNESTRYHEVTVSTVLGGDLWRSVCLVVPPTIASILIAIPIGLTPGVSPQQALRPHDDDVVYVLYSTPAILVCTAHGVLLRRRVGTRARRTVRLDALRASRPARSRRTCFHNFNEFILPFIAIIFLSIGGLTRYMRGSALDTLVQDYVRTARAKGAGPTRVLFRHVMRPSLIPLITIIGLTIPVIIGGALIVEAIFNYPGHGPSDRQLGGDGDFTVVMAITLFTAVLTVAGNLLADVFMAVADPRVRLRAR